MKTFVIAWTTHREIVRRPLYWLLVGVAAALLLAFMFIPYFTLGEDIKMVKDQGLTVVMLTGLVVAVFSASVSIADEIDGKTAITLLSKPIRRRDFIFGKFFGIMSAVAVLFVMLGAVFLGTLFFKAGYDARENARDIPSYVSRLPMLWQMLPGLVLSYFQVTVLCALSVAFSTRFPVHWNVTLCIIVYLFGHLAPMIEAASRDPMIRPRGAIEQVEVVVFMARFFGLIFPGLEYFNVGPAIATDAQVPWLAYVLPCFAYCVTYTAIALVLALLMFEDRDLA